MTNGGVTLLSHFLFLRPNDSAEFIFGLSGYCLAVGEIKFYFTSFPLMVFNEY